MAYLARIDFATAIAIQSAVTTAPVAGVFKTHEELIGVALLREWRLAGPVQFVLRRAIPPCRFAKKLHRAAIEVRPKLMCLTNCVSYEGV